MDISKLSPKSGRIIGEDGKIYNRVSLLRGTVPVSDKVVNIAKLAAESGRLIGEDGKIYNEVDLLNGLNDRMDNIEEEVEDLSKLTKWLGVTTTPITENSTVNPIMISGISVMAVSGDIARYSDDNFKFTDVGTWQYYNDKTDVYTKDETDLLLDEKVDKIPGKGLSSNDFTDAYANKVNTSEILLKDNAPKNLLCTTLDDLKAANTTGTWGTTSSYRTTYSIGNATFTVKTNESGIVESLGTGEAMIFESGAEMMYAVNKMLLPEGDYILSAQIDDVTPADAKMYWIIENLGGSVIDSDDVTLESGYNSADITVSAGAERYLSVYYAIGDQGVTPIDPHFGALGTVQTMLRYAEVTDNTFEVAYRTQKDIDAALVSVQNGLASKLDTAGGTVTGAVKTTKSTFTDNDEFVPKSYVDTHGITDYTQLTNKPSINNVTLTGNKTLSDLGLSEHDNYTKTLLWENPSGMTVVSPITLADDYTNYDLIVFELAINSIINIQQFTIDTAAFETNITCCLSYQGKSMGIHPTTSTSLEAVTWDGGNTYVIQKIYGVKLGARRPYKETVLYSNDSSVYGDQNGPLAASLTDFDAVYYYIRYGARGDANNRLFTFMLDATRLETGTSYNAGTLDGYRWDINFPTMDSFSFATNYQNDLKIEKIIGISYGGSVKGRNVTKLYPSVITTGGTYNLTDNIDNYDEIHIGVSWYSSVNKHSAIVIPKFDIAAGKNWFFTFENMWFSANIVEPTNDEIGFGFSNGFTIDSIYGIKYDSDYITIDSEMSSTSENPVQNKTVTAAINSIISRLEALEGNV